MRKTLMATLSTVSIAALAWAVSADAADIRKTISLGTGNSFTEPDGASYVLLNESFYTSPRWMSSPVKVVVQGRELYVPEKTLKYERLLKKSALARSVLSWWVMSKTYSTAAGEMVEMSNLFVKDGYYWYVGYPSANSVSVTDYRSGYWTLGFRESEVKELSRCLMVHEWPFSDDGNLTVHCWDAPVKMLKVWAPELKGIPDERLFMETLANDFDQWPEEHGRILAKNAGKVVDYMRSKALKAGKDAGAIHARVSSSSKYDAGARKAISDSSWPADLQARLGKLDPKIHSGLSVLANGSWVCDGISAAAFYLMSLNGIGAEIIEGDADDGWTSVPHAWIRSGGLHYDPTFDVGRKTPAYSGLTESEMNAKSARKAYSK